MNAGGETSERAATEKGGWRVLSGGRLVRLAPASKRNVFTRFILLPPIRVSNGNLCRWAVAAFWRRIAKTQVVGSQFRTGRARLQRHGMAGRQRSLGLLIS